jgi:hypothetical protein
MNGIFNVFAVLNTQTSQSVMKKSVGVNIASHESTTNIVFCLKYQSIFYFGVPFVG